MTYTLNSPNTEVPSLSEFTTGRYNFPKTNIIMYAKRYKLRGPEARTSLDEVSFDVPSLEASVRVLAC